ncbi:MAG: hypothetical protein JW912_00830 [Sedimentisphaerales bacterium]|nr:hypothetical protein [Sedimentisphaerales bacterium]
MDSSKIKTKCSKIRIKLTRYLAMHINPDSFWLQNHIANCPRCQRRLSVYGKVEVAMSLLKTQPHELDLLTRANTQALKMLKHGLRFAPKADKLKQKRPQPIWILRYSGFSQSIVNAAACVTILVLLKAGVFSSMDNVQQNGSTAVKGYYSKYLDQSTANEIFG